MSKRNTYFEDEIIQRKIDIKQLVKVFRYIIPYKYFILLVIALMLVSAAVAMVPPLLLRYIIDSVIKTEKIRDLGFAIAGLLVCAMIEIAITYVHQRLMGITGHKIIAKIRQDAFYKLQKLPFDYFDSRPDGKIVVRVTDYVNDLANFFTNFIVLFMVYIIKIVVATVFMLSLSVPLTVVVFIVVIPMMICVFYLRYKIRRLFTYLRQKNSNRTAFLVESIMGEKIIKSYNRADKNIEIYDEIHEKAWRTWLKIFYRNELNSPIVGIFWNAGTILLYGTALYLTLNRSTTMEAGTVVAFIGYMGLFNAPLTQIAIIIQQLANVSSNMEQVFDTIEYPVEIEDSADSIELKDIEGKVVLKNVTFGYEEGVLVLENVNLKVKAGDTIALVGPTGAGKTSIINLLTRFYDVVDGQVMIDSKDVREVQLESLRREVGVLMQDPFIFKGTIMENIRYGKPEATDEKCIEAAKTIFADRFISKLPDGYDTVLEEHGQGLATGEKQLLSFARIILKDPSIVILDEATSSIDTETENMIKEALDVLLKDKTAFIVAHRLSTIRNADRILYIANKGIVEDGTHDELMEKKGLYYALNV